jgi:hypothetical protein
VREQYFVEGHLSQAADPQAPGVFPLPMGANWLSSTKPWTVMFGCGA